MARWSLRSDFLEEFLAKVGGGWGGAGFLDTYTRAVAVHFALLERITCAGARAKRSSGSAFHHEIW